MASIFTVRSSCEGIWPVMRISLALSETAVDDLKNLNVSHEQSGANEGNLLRLERRKVQQTLYNLLPTSKRPSYSS